MAKNWGLIGGYIIECCEESLRRLGDRCAPDRLPRLKSCRLSQAFGTRCAAWRAFAVGQTAQVTAGIGARTGPRWGHHGRAYRRHDLQRRTGNGAAEDTSRRTSDLRPPATWWEKVWGELVTTDEYDRQPKV